MIGDLLKVAALFGSLVLLVWLLGTDDARSSKACAVAEALIDGKPAEVHHLTDKLTGRTVRFASYGHAAIILPDAPPITVEKQ